MPDLSTVGELADYLATQPRDRKIVLTKDAERNDFSPLADAGERMYYATSTWSGEMYQTPEVVEAEPDDWSPAPDDAERVIVLGPVN